MNFKNYEYIFDENDFDIIETIEYLEKNPKWIAEDKNGKRYEYIEGALTEIVDKSWLPLGFPMRVTSKFIKKRFRLLKKAERKIEITETQAKQIVLLLGHAMYPDVEDDEMKKLIDMQYDLDYDLSDKLGIEAECNYYDINTLELKNYY